MTRGLNQRELASLSGLGYRTIQTVEQGSAPVRIATIRAIAGVFLVKTEELLAPGQDERPDPLKTDPWEDVRAVLYRDSVPEEPVSEGEVLAGLAAIMPYLAANQYDRARLLLPALIRDSATLDGTSGRTARSRVLGATASVLTHNRQWEDAWAAGQRAVDAAQEPADRVAAVHTMCWLLLRQGRLSEASALAERWADETEPRRFSRASNAELASWGKTWLYVANAAIRNNQPGAAEDALANATAAAARIGREVRTDQSTSRTFGTGTVPLIVAETALLAGKPDKVIETARRISPADLARAQDASRHRHGLDVAAAYAEMRKWPKAVNVLDGLRREAPQWFAQQRMARDVMEGILNKRRTLTPQMREIATAVRIGL